MEMNLNHNIPERRVFVQSNASAVKWFKEWVPQDVVATGGKCYLLKWVTEKQLKAIREKENEVEPEPEPEPTTEVLFLCSYEGCGKTFIDAGALRKHSHIHGERQYVCHYEGCGKKFLDSSKLKRHFLIHTGERDFICPHQGCGKAFSLDFNLRSHMKTHSQENYHICPHPDCGKRYAHEYKLKNHIASHHEKQSLTPELEKSVIIPEKAPKASKPQLVGHGSGSVERPYTCPYQGCDKAYIHEYKLKLHLRREHPDHMQEERGPDDSTSAKFYNNEIEDGSDQDMRVTKRARVQKPYPERPKMLPPKLHHNKEANMPFSVVGPPRQLRAREEGFEEDSEETEEDCDNEDGWLYENRRHEYDEEADFED